LGRKVSRGLCSISPPQLTQRRTSRTVNVNSVDGQSPERCRLSTDTSWGRLEFLQSCSACPRVSPARTCIQAVVPNLMEPVRQDVRNVSPQGLQRFHESNTTMLRSEDDAYRGKVHDPRV